VASGFAFPVIHAPASKRPLYIGMRVTREEYLDLEEDGFYYDVVRGVMQLSPSGDFEHGKRALDFGTEINLYLRQRKIGKAVAEIDVLLPDGGDPLRPDISVILTPNLGIVKKHILGAPDLIAEILSPSTRAFDLGAKADRYLASGVREFWIIDPAARTLQLWQNQDRTSWQKTDAGVLRSSVLPGFELNAADFFAE